MGKESEVERIQRLRAARLKDRDPGAKIKVQWKGQSARKQEPLLKEIWSVFPGRVQGALVGIAFYFVAQMALPDEWKSLCGLTVILLAVVLGMIIGKVMDKDTWKTSA